MAEPRTNEFHEIYVWNAAELLEATQKLKEGVRTSVEANERLKGFLDADAVALAQFIQAGSRVARQIKLLGILGRAYIKEVNGKKYIIFKGDPHLRLNLAGTRYLAENAKVRCFVVGGKEILEDAAKGTKIAIIAFIAIDIAMEVTSDHFSIASLGVRISSDVLQAGLSTAAGVGAGVLVASVLGAPVVVTFIVVVAVGFMVGVLLTEIDRRYRLTDRLRARMMAVEQEVLGKLPALKQEALLAGRTAAQYARQAGQELHADYYRVDRFFTSAAAMLEADAAELWRRP